MWTSIHYTYNRSEMQQRLSFLLKKWKLRGFRIQKLWSLLGYSWADLCTRAFKSAMLFSRKSGSMRVFAGKSRVQLFTREFGVDDRGVFRYFRLRWSTSPLYNSLLIGIGVRAGRMFGRKDGQWSTGIAENQRLIQLEHFQKKPISLREKKCVPFTRIRDLPVCPMA